MRSKLLTNLLATAVAAACTAGTAMAATVKVPFNFTAAGKDCPAGLYSVDADLMSRSLVTLRSQDGSRQFTWSIRPGDPSPNDMRMVLKFADAGQTHVLESVQYENKVTSKLDGGSEQPQQGTMQGFSGR